MEGSVNINIFIHLLLYFNNIIQGQAEILSCGIFPFIIPYNTNDSECIDNQVVPRTTEASTQENIYCGYSPIPYDANKYECVHNSIVLKTNSSSLNDEMTTPSPHHSHDTFSNNEFVYVIIIGIIPGIILGIFIIVVAIVVSRLRSRIYHNRVPTVEV